MSTHATRPPPLRRRDWPRWTCHPARLLVLILLWPVLKILEWTGYWPRAMGRALNRRMFAVAPFKPATNDVLIGSYLWFGAAGAAARRNC